MKNQIIALLAACVLTVTPAFAASNYYVDDTGGNDANTGTSSGAAWRTLTNVNARTFVAGDQVLFKRGGSWANAQLHPLGSGSSGSPIIIDAYGSGALPRFDGNGAVADTVYLYNQQYWEIRNLEVTNSAGTVAVRTGVKIEIHNLGTGHSIHLVDLDVHDVSGDSTVKENGGILFTISGTSTPTTFDDILVDGCYVHSVTRTGILTTSTWSTRTPMVNTNWTPSTNVVVRNCVVSDAQANGMIIRVAQSPLIEHCLFANNGNGGSGNAVFVYNCDDSVIQFNEAYGTIFDAGDVDAGGFDGDYRCARTTIQYNYAHDNGLAGIVLISDDQPHLTNAVIRYNVLQNNARQAFRLTGNVTDAQIYNNTIFIGSALSAIEVVRHKAGTGNHWPDNTHYKNNLIYSLATGCSYNFGSSTNTGFDSNLFYGQHPATEPADANKLTTDPLFLTAGTGSLGEDTVGGYMLMTGSPAIGSGTLITTNGGTDYWGNSVSTTVASNRGAYNGAALSNEGEDCTVQATSGATAAVLSDINASGGKWLKYSSAAVNDYVVLARYLPAGTYAITVTPKMQLDRGIYQLATADAAAGPFTNKDGPKDQYSAATAWTPAVFTSTVTFATAGTKYFRFTITGKNAASSGYTLGVDKLTLTKQ